MKPDCKQRKRVANYTYPNGDEIGIYLEENTKNKWAFGIDQWWGKDGEDGGWVNKSDFKYKSEREAATEAFNVIIVSMIAMRNGPVAVAFKHMMTAYLSPQLSLPFF